MLVCRGLQLPLPPPVFLCTSLVPRRYIGLLPTAQELAGSVWQYDVTPTLTGHEPNVPNANTEKRIQAEQGLLQQWP